MKKFAAFTVRLPRLLAIFSAAAVMIASGGGAVPYFDFDNSPIAIGNATVRELAATVASPDVTGSALADHIRDTAKGGALAGAGGDDTYEVTSSATTIVEGANGGIDTVRTIRSISLGANVENLVLVARDITGVGNALANLITTTASGTTLIGGAGNDVLVDTTTGAATRFAFARGSGLDTVYGFDGVSAAHDIVRLHDFGLTHFDQVRARLSQQGDDVLLTLGDTDKILFRGTKVADFSTDDFELQLDLSGYTRTFADEFTTAISLYDLATGDGQWKTNGFYGMQTGQWATGSRTLNDELQIYVDPNYEGTGAKALGLNPFSVADGMLTITASRTPAGVGTLLADKAFVSGEITTERSFAQLYGYFEIRAQLPGDKGMWPAFWLLPAAGGQPPEIDVFEQVGTDDIFQSIHTTDPTRARSSTMTSYLPSNDTAFHTYGLQWTATTLTWYIDGVATGSMATPSDMHQPMYLLANLAVGGGWAGNPDATLQSSRYTIDYIRAYALPDSVGVTRTGTAANDALVGTAGNDAIDAGAGNDTLDGAGGADRLAGGAGDDSYVVYSARDVVVERAGEGSDLIRSWADVRLPDAVENATLLGLGDLDATGNALANILTGNWGRNRLDGGDGNDILDATGGRTWNAGAQGDTLIGGRGDDVFVTDDASDVLVELAGQGTDTVRAGYHFTLADHFENLELTGWARNATGNAADNILTGNGNDNWMWGMDGDDVLYGRDGNDNLDGSGGRDVLHGGRGDDVFIVSEGDSVVELAGEGADTVKSWVSVTLGDHVEALELFEGGDLDGIGNALANTLLGNARANTLDGGAGDDIIDGRGGRDTLTGGGGSDVFRAEIAGQITITDFGRDGEKDMLSLRAGGDVLIKTVAGGTAISIGDISVLLAGVSPDALLRTATGFESRPVTIPVTPPAPTPTPTPTPEPTPTPTPEPLPVVEPKPVPPVEVVQPPQPPVDPVDPPKPVSKVEDPDDVVPPPTAITLTLDWPYSAPPAPTPTPAVSDQLPHDPGALVMVAPSATLWVDGAGSVMPPAWQNDAIFDHASLFLIA